MNEQNLIIQSIKDFLTPKMIKYSLAPIVVTLIIMYVMFFILAGIGADHISQMHIQAQQSTIQNGVTHTQSIDTYLEDTALIQFLMSYAATAWIATFLIYALGAFLALYASIFIAIIVIGFVTPYVLKELQKRHYQDVELIGYSNIFTALLSTLKWIGIMLLLFILLIPFYFIPFINIIAFNFPLYYFFHKMLNYDISTNMTTKDEALEIRYKNKTMLRIKTLLLYLISLVPFVIFFTTVFFVIYLGHTYFLETRKLRVKDAIPSSN
ncbi:EI24 domain-containing protein [Sulfurimonas sp.]|uniref:EI24 domain-containing protein n=1 Tax=Sulfurimonas sp. TaxID=2022749 RepID=UPI0035617F4F